MRLRWRLYERHFNGPGAYTLTMGDRPLVISVDADQVFEVTEEDRKDFPFSFYGFADRAPAIADERSKENIELAENVRLRVMLRRVA